MSTAKQLVEQLLESEPGAAFSHTAQKILNVIHSGPIRAIGGIVYDSDMRPLMNTTELHGVIQELGQRGIVINRKDSGGSPRWDVEPSDEDEVDPKDFVTQRDIQLPPGDIIVGGSHGELTCDHATGCVMSLQDDGDDEENYRHIARVDIDEFKRWLAKSLPAQKRMKAGHVIDIMFIGYWTKDGTYEPPVEEMRDQYLHDLNNPVNRRHA